MASFSQRLRRHYDNAAALWQAMKETVRTTTTKLTKAAKIAANPVPLSLSIISPFVPLDFSPPAKNALDYAVAFARRFRAKLPSVHVVGPVATPDFGAAFPLMTEDNELTAGAKNILEGAVKAARIPCSTVEKVLVRFGCYSHEIRHVRLGSTTERVTHHAPCPVLVVRQR